MPQICLLRIRCKRNFVHFCCPPPRGGWIKIMNSTCMSVASTWPLLGGLEIRLLPPVTAAMNLSLHKRSNWYACDSTLTISNGHKTPFTQWPEIVHTFLEQHGPHNGTFPDYFEDNFGACEKAGKGLSGRIKGRKSHFCADPTLKMAPAVTRTRSWHFCRGGAADPADKTIR